MSDMSDMSDHHDFDVLGMHCKRQLPCTHSLPSKTAVKLMGGVDVLRCTGTDEQAGIKQPLSKGQ